jgi:hypothetical protein
MSRGIIWINDEYRCQFFYFHICYSKPNNRLIYLERNTEYKMRPRKENEEHHYLLMPIHYPSLVVLINYGRFPWISMLLLTEKRSTFKLQEKNILNNSVCVGLGNIPNLHVHLIGNINILLRTSLSVINVWVCALRNLSLESAAH